MLVVLAGCNTRDKTANTRVEDQCLRRELFKECLNIIPAGPLATKYNDWDEVVEACGLEAYRMSLRQVDQVRPECRP